MTQEPENTIAGFVGKAWLDDRPVPDHLIGHEFERLTTRYQENDPDREPAEYLDQVREDALHNAVERLILQTEASEAGIAVSDKHLDRRFRTWVKELGGTEAFREQTGTSLEDEPRIKIELRNQIQIDRFLDQLTAQVTPPTHEEIAAYYEEHPERFLIPESLSFRVIRLTPEHGPVRDHAAHLLNLQSLIKKGTMAFDDLFKRANEDGIGETVTFEALETLVQRYGEKINTVQLDSNPHVLSTRNGELLLWLDQRIDAFTPSLDDVSERVRNLLHDNRKEAAIGEWIDSALERYTVRVEPASDPE